MLSKKSSHLLTLGILASLTLTACGGSSKNNSHSPKKAYKVTVRNVTASQPFSPAAVIVHLPAYSAFKPGQAASTALEHLAESGSNKQLLAEAQTNKAVISSKSGNGAIPPGGMETISISVPQSTTGFKLTLASMLVNTNDGFASRTTSTIADLNVGDSVDMNLLAWDAGTEVNDEASGVPGPASGGSGFDASRQGDTNFVAIHRGVVTKADGLLTSKLNESHRFDNPVGLLHIERVE